jgi:hypothetical protein
MTHEARCTASPPVVQGKSINSLHLGYVPTNDTVCEAFCCTDRVLTSASTRLSRILEGNLSTNLPEPWEKLAGNLAEVSLRGVRLNVLEIGMVEEIEEFKAQLEINPFGDAGILVESEISLHIGRIAESVGFFITLVPRGGRGELSRRKDSSDVRTSGIALLIARHIWIVQIVPVGVIIAAASERGGSKHSEWITCLINAGPANAPSTRDSA